VDDRPFGLAIGSVDIGDGGRVRGKHPAKTARGSFSAQAA
jgi:hypothetical protein